ncbi:MAG: N-formylglutamate deformylase [Alphaproteobacteria bacterium]
MDLYRYRQGNSPLLVSMPHSGLHIPDDLKSRMTDAGRLMADTDWHVDRLYDFLDGLDATVVIATHSRYVIDLNRPPDGSSLYPGQSVTELVPTSTFDEEPIYLPGEGPDKAEVERRRTTYWQPYHDRLEQELTRLTARHGRVVQYDAHSIRSEVPRFFDGRLPDFNLGTGAGASADAGLANRLLAVCQKASGYSAILNGRFKGGHITRSHGRPAGGVHAVQMELSQATYMDEAPPFTFRDDLAAKVRPHLKAVLEEAIAWAAAAPA